MVDFTKRLGKKAATKPIDPIQIYDTLDRASDKGPLRQAQAAVLKEWHDQRRNKRDAIVKLHTGQGKTLIGLLILQSKLNEDGGPVVYLCANNFLINQTCTQATQFGVSFCIADDDLPAEFLDGKSILITSVQKMFNGMTKFGLGASSVAVSTVLMDDAHACIDSIRDSLQIRIPANEQAYTEIRNLFSSSLEYQGAGTYADICNKNPEAYLLVPYWEWRDKNAEVVDTLAKYTASNSIKFAWPLIKDLLQDCQCVVSGKSLEIAPYLPPLHLFGSFYKARHRVFMSATVVNDSFLIKGLGLSPETITDPLVYKDEKWSGEKMILISSLIDESLSRGLVVETFAKSSDRRTVGVVALVPSFSKTSDWKGYGASIATRENIDAQIDKLLKGDFKHTLVIVNRYDGIDLPDSACRVLVFDSKPYSESLVDTYIEGCRANSEATAMRTARTIEQGLGRSVRGEKDYCAIILTGADLIRRIRPRDARKHLSSQTRKQIEIGIEIAEMAQEEIEKGALPSAALSNLINQCLRRDPGWKAYYTKEMDTVVHDTPDANILEIFQMELQAEKKFQGGDVEDAVQVIQSLLNKLINDDGDKGWYLQEMARYQYRQSKSESNDLQINAHRKNHFLLKPRIGMKMTTITVISQKRIENIISQIQQFEDFQELSIHVEDNLSSLDFGVRAEKFEASLDELAKLLGFAGQRPDKEWREGPDNLWCLRAGEYLLVECKSEDKLTRSEINKREAEQMNRSSAWFAKYYAGAKVKRVMIIPTDRLSSAAGFIDEVEIMRQQELQALTGNVRRFFSEFRSVDFKDLSEKKVQQLIDAHKLSVDAILTEYTKPVRSGKE